MSLGLFDVVGPLMHGPSSNHTGGANRIGFLAKELMGGIPEKIRLGFHPVYMASFVGQRTHSAMIAGLLGHREYEDESAGAMEELEAKGIPWEAYAFSETEMSRNTFRAVGEINGETWEVNGDSIGGGNIVIDRINGLPAHLDGNRWELVITCTDKNLFDKAVAAAHAACSPSLPEGIQGQALGDKWLYIGVYSQEPFAGGTAPEALAGGDLVWRKVPPLYKFSDQCDTPLYTRYADFLPLCKDRPMLDVVLDYEANRSRVSREDILAEALFMVEEIEKALYKAEHEPIHMIGELTDPQDGKNLMRWAKSGNAVVSEMFATGLARAVLLGQINASGGKVVAAPTGGAAGAMPGALFTAAERYGKSKQELAEAFLIAAAIGLIIGNQASFSGTVGGCQSEVGIGCSMAAGAIAWMAGGTPDQVVHAATIALKNVLGITCDPPAPPTEIPCIKRNAMGVAVAFMGAELGLAGVRSAVDPDDVVAALAETQRLIPMELKFSHCGGLATTPSGRSIMEQWQKRLKTLK